MTTTDLFGIEGKSIAGTYRVEEAIAEGGFGVVYRAHHKGFRAKVALKCLKIPIELGREHRAQFLEQFRSEAEVLFRLSALMPNIVRPLHVDAFQAPDGRFVPFMALEWLDGWTLDSVIAQRAAQGRPPINLKKLVRMLTPVARALDQAHNMPGPTGTMSIVHRDMKPENLFVALIGGEQIVKILDFGISKVKSTAGQMAGRASQTGAGLVSFSPAYGAPEQWVPKRYGQTGPWTDVWGIALTIVEAAKGEEVVTGDQAAMMGTILDPSRRPTPRNEGVRVADRVEAIFERALAVDPQQRHQSVNAFWSELLDALDLDQLGNPRRVERPDPRADGTAALTQEQLEAALSPRLSHISGLRPAVEPHLLLRKVPSRPDTEGSLAVARAVDTFPEGGDSGRGRPASIIVPKGASAPSPSRGERRAVDREAETQVADVAVGSGARARGPDGAQQELAAQVASQSAGRLELASTARRPPGRAARGGPARAYGVVPVRHRPSLVRALLPSFALLLLSVAFTLLDRAWAMTNGQTLTFGPLRASWLAVIFLVCSLVSGISTVRRTLD